MPGASWATARPRLAQRRFKSKAISNAIRVSSGETQSCALKSDHSVWCLGQNTSFQARPGAQSTSQIRPAPECGYVPPDALVVPFALAVTLDLHALWSGLPESASRAPDAARGRPVTLEGDGRRRAFGRG